MFACNYYLVLADRFCLKDWEVLQRDQAVASYERFIRRNGYPDAKLQLFGSSRNGFGFTKSDMDICLKFQQYENAEVRTLFKSKCA